jgi:hypothetical protein
MKKITVLLSMIFLFGIGQALAQRQIEKAFAIGAGKYVTLPISPDNVETVNGRFEAQGGSGNDVVVFIVDEDGLTNWKNGHSVSTYYNSGRKTVGTFKVTLDPGNYFIVISNTFSTYTGKAVTLKLWE